jgi:hypothetical protein
VIKQFPTSPEGKKALHTRMVAVAPDLMDDIAEIRKGFPSAKMTVFLVGDVGYGKLADGWLVDDALVARVEAAFRKKNPTPEVIEARRADRIRHDGIKRRLAK